VDLAAIRADGWFEDLAQDTPDFDELCQVMGRRFVAFSFVAGVRIASVAYDQQSPHASLVDFTVGGSEEVQRTNLGDLREQLGTVLLADDEPEVALPNDPSDPDILRYIGRRYMLLAPIFGIGLQALEIGGGGEPMLQLEFGGAAEVLSVAGLRDAIHSAIRSEVARSRPTQAFSIDFKKIPLAEAANARADYDETIALLGSWPGPLSMFLRTAQGQNLGTPERSRILRALAALGDAYLRKRQNDWAEDVLRLGIQFGQELDASGPLFGLLGQARLATGRYGEAIGLLRRAITLGDDKRNLLPALARCFIERGRYVAAMACLSEARAAGVDAATLMDLDARVEQALGPALARYRGLLTEG
jgi:tetratricopeptide (TPR) repeat protein